MSFNKIRTIRVSERVFDLVCEELDNEQTNNNVKIEGWLETFNNCREQGYVLHLDSTDFKNDKRTEENLYVWAFESRNSDDIVVSWQTDYPNNGMFSDETYKERREYFRYNGLQEAADFIIDLVKEHFAQEFRGK
jgi:hypothetical protein